MPSIHTIMRRRKLRIQEVYSKNNRVINPTLYHKLKQKKKCDDRDGKRRFQIHHKVSIKDGGGNEEANLMAVSHMSQKTR